MNVDPYFTMMSRFCVIFTRSVIAWNRAEDAARRILQSLAEGGLGSLAAITHLGNRGLDDAILTVADYYDDPETPNLQELAEHLRHYVAGLGVLRGYRNFYVHSMHGMGQQNRPDGKFIGTLSATEAKGRYAWINQEVSDDELKDFMDHCERLQKYGRGIVNCVAKDSALLKLLKNPPPKQPLSLLEKPQWPPQLKKIRHYLLERSPPTEPSGA